MTADVPARVRWQVTPALRTAEFFERLYAALAGDAGGGDEGVNLFAEFSAELQRVPD